jgi:hypothetical protein
MATVEDAPLCCLGMPKGESNDKTLPTKLIPKDGTDVGLPMLCHDGFDERDMLTIWPLNAFRGLAVSPSNETPELHVALRGWTTIGLAVCTNLTRG